jgi:hypothetical protein
MNMVTPSRTVPFPYLTPMSQNADMSSELCPAGGSLASGVAADEEGPPCPVP